MAKNRKIFRQKFAQLLARKIAVPEGESIAENPDAIVAKVYDYNVSAFEGNNPVVVVKSGSSFRPPLTAMGNSLEAVIECVVFVRYSFPDDVDWKEEESEDRLDDIEAAIADVVENNKSYSEGGFKYWDNLRYEASTVTGSLAFEKVEGENYRIEAIRLLANAYDNTDLGE